MVPSIQTSVVWYYPYLSSSINSVVRQLSLLNGSVTSDLNTFWGLAQNQTKSGVNLANIACIFLQWIYMY